MAASRLIPRSIPNPWDRPLAVRTMSSFDTIVECHHADAPNQHFATTRTVSVVTGVAGYIAHIDEVEALGHCSVARARKHSHRSTWNVLQPVARMKACKMNGHIRAKISFDEACKLAGFLFAVVEAGNEQRYDFGPDLPFCKQP